MRTLWALVLVTTMLAGCRSGGMPAPGQETAPAEEKRAPAPAATEEAAQGHELYSWQRGSEWAFALLPGTGKIRTFEEVTRPEATLSTITDLKNKLRGLPRGTRIEWSTHQVSNMVMPSNETIATIQGYCAQRGLELEISQ